MKKRGKVAGKLFRTATLWQGDDGGLRDAFGNPVAWEPGKLVRYYAGGRRVYMRKRIGASVPDDMREVIEKAAKATGLPMAEIVRQCVEDKLSMKNFGRARSRGASGI